MKKRLIITTIIIGVLSFAIGMGTFAYFTSQATSKNNVFAAGTLKIGVPNEGENAGVIKFENKQPGDFQEASLVVKNLGTLPFKYKVTTSSAIEDVLLYNKLDLVVKLNNQVVYNGKLSGFNKEINPNLAAGAEETLTFTLTFPADSGNEYQGKTSNILFTFDATQTNNPGYGQ